MDTIIITSGEKYIDIDAFSCAFAYRELLLAEGNLVETVLPGSANHSVTDFCRSLAGDFFVTKATLLPKKIVVVDISEPDFFPAFATPDKVGEVYDHHFGFEKFWEEKIGNRAKIEPVGACATLIWEEFQKRNHGEISRESAMLLALAIVSNTLNFRASITKNRDCTAFKELNTRFPLPPDTIKNLFLDQEKTLYQNIPEAIKGDTKTLFVPNFEKTFVIGQIELWESESFLHSHIDVIHKTMTSFQNPHWILSSPSISEGKTFFVTEDPFLQKIFSEEMHAVFNENFGVAPRLWLRKEILQKLLHRSH